MHVCMLYIRITIILPTKTAAAQNEVALSYHNVRGLYFLRVVFAATIVFLYFLLLDVKKRQQLKNKI